VGFWIVMLTVLAVTVAAFWYVLVVVVIPFVDAVRDAYFYNDYGSEPWVLIR
jgi:uncharacterized membrane-anchored protein